jgi:xylono-1,5-lactonase
VKRVGKMWRWAVLAYERSMTKHSTVALTESASWRVVAAPRDVVGEGPVYVANEDAVYWVDISAGRLRRYALDTQVFNEWILDEPIGFAVPRAKGGLILGLASGLHLFEPAFPLMPPRIIWRNTEPYHRLNDGAVDRDGRLWFGVMHCNGDQPSGRLMCFDNGTVRIADSGYCVPNGPVFSMDGSIMFHADSRRGEIYSFALSPTGELSNRRIHIKFAPEAGVPDGMTLDEEGCLWVAHWGGGCVSCFDQDGTLKRRIDLPVSLVTNCVFGGSNHSRMFITTAGAGSGEDELAGALFEVDPGVRGLMQAIVSR